MQNENHLYAFDVSVRRTLLLPMVKLFLLQAAFIVIYGAVLWKLNDISQNPLKAGGIIVFLVLQTIQSLWGLGIILRWFFDYYRITPKEILVHSGVIFQKRKHFALEKAEAVSVEKGILGRLFNFGTICVELFMSNSRYEVYLYNISNPENYMRMIEKSITEFGNNGKNNINNNDE
jgi:uncharacterized membrane protein YdbT with pleckstrin-like domain